MQVLALTATGAGLDKIGSEYGVTRNAAVAAVLEDGLTGVNGTNVPLGTQWTANSTGEIYTSLAAVVIAGGVATVNVEAATPGETGNLANGEEMTINTPIAGLDSTATVTDTITLGADRETDTAYRRRVLTRIRAGGGGGNAADYRQWGEAVALVRRVFPFAGKPRNTDIIGISLTFDAAAKTVFWNGGDWRANDVLLNDKITFADTANNNGTFTVTSINLAGDTLTTTGPHVDEGPVATDVTLESAPSDRSVYVESTDTGVNGVPTAAILEAVRAALLNDPDTGLARPPLGLIDERLYVEPIVRLGLKVRINGLVIDAGIEAATKAKILEAVEDHLYNRIVMFVDGLDYPGDRMDSITELTISNVVWGVLKVAGGVADDIEIKLVRDDVPAYQLNRGEMVVSDGVTYDGWV